MTDSNSPLTMSDITRAIRQLKPTLFYTIDHNLKFSEDIILADFDLFSINKTGIKTIILNKVQALYVLKRLRKEGFRLIKMTNKNLEKYSKTKGERKCRTQSIQLKNSSMFSTKFSIVS